MKHVANLQGKSSDDVSLGKAVSFDPGVLKIPDESSDNFCLLGSKCSSCGGVYFPQRVICPVCFRDDTMEGVPLSKRGKLYSFSITRRQFLCPPGFTAPYAFGNVDLPEGVRVLALLKEWEPDLLRLNLEMELGIEPAGEDKSGNQVIGFYFRPIGNKRSNQRKENEK